MELRIVLNDGGSVNEWKEWFIKRSTPPFIGNCEDWG